MIFFLRRTTIVAPSGETYTAVNKSIHYHTPCTLSSNSHFPIRTFHTLTDSFPLPLGPFVFGMNRSVPKHGAKNILPLIACFAVPAATTSHKMTHIPIKTCTLARFCQCFFSLEQKRSFSLFFLPP